MIAVLGADLLLGSRLVAEAERQDTALTIVARPEDLPDPAQVRLLLVDWGSRQAGWAEAIGEWQRHAPAAPSVMLFGPHVDLEAHAAARASGLGPMKARSWLVAHLPAVVGG